MFLYARFHDLNKPIEETWVEIRPVDYTFALTSGPVSGDGVDSWKGLRLNGYPVLSKSGVEEFRALVSSCSDLAKDTVVIVFAELWTEEQMAQHLRQEVSKLGWGRTA
jgi:hypothetical protein